MPVVFAQLIFIFLSTHCNIENITEHIAKTVNFSYWQMAVDGCPANLRNREERQPSLSFDHRYGHSIN